METILAEHWKSWPGAAITETDTYALRANSNTLCSQSKYWTLTMQHGKSQEVIDRPMAERRIIPEAGTERPFAEESDHKEAGIYVDIVSGDPRFASSDKFEIASLRFIHRDDMESEGYGEYVDQVEEV